MTGAGRSSLVRISKYAAITAMYETPSIANDHPKPATSMTTPASAGPTIRDPIISALFKLTAFCTWSSGTISTTNERRAGLSNAVANPPAMARR